MTAADLAAAVAVTGMACRFPAAPDLATYWRNLCAGVDTVQRFDLGELRRSGVAEDLLAHPSFVPACAPIPDPYVFDEAHFGVTPATARVLDPQHRVFLECAWTALETSGTLASRNSAVGVFAGCSDTTYQAMRDEWRGQGNSLAADLGTSSDYFATRVAFLLDLRGPAVTVRTACSTSLVAIHLAVQSLLTYECDVAVAGGAAIRHPLRRGHLYEPDGVYSVDGRCRPYDLHGSGIVSGDGAGAVVLRRLADAVEDGDHIHAVIRGSATNNDGAGKAGFTAPGVAGQAEVARTALDLAGVEPETVGFVEGHGTATPLGDPIEVEALSRIWTTRRRGGRPVVLGSVKSGIGHLDAAAGVASFIKACLAVEHGRIPGTLHYTAPNPHSGLPDSAFVVSAETLDWEEGPRRAGVHSLGLGGTNAHVVLEQAAPRPAAVTGPDTAPVALAMSARRLDALGPYAEAVATAIETAETNLAVVAHTLHTARTREPYRRVVVGGSREELVRSLRSPSPPPRPTANPPRLVVVFPGYGKHVRDALRELGGHLPVVAETLREAAVYLRSRWQVDLFAVTSGAEPNATGVLPSIVAQGLAMHAALDSFGAGGDVVLGQSLGEITAAAAAGLIGMTDALDLAMAREHAIRAIIPSGAAVVGMGPEDLVRRLPPDVELSLVNSPYRCVVTGRTQALARFADEVAAQNVPVHRLNLISAVHSSLLDPVLDGIHTAASRLTFRKPTRTLLSTLGPVEVDERVAADPRHWVRHFREPVRMDTCFRAAVAGKPDTVLLEVGPAAGLSAAIRETVGEDARAVVTAARQADDTSELDALGHALGRLWEEGVPVDWAAWPRRAARKTVLPVPPLARTVHAPERPTLSPRPRPSRVARWGRSWQRMHLPGGQRSGRVAVLVGRDEFGRTLADELERRGHDVDVLAPEAGPIDHDLVVDARALDASDGPTATAEFLAVAAVAVRAGRESSRLVVLTRGALDIVGAEPVSPAAAAVAAAALVVAQEHDGLRVTCLDVAGAAVDVDLVERVLLADDAAGTLVGLRERSLWRPVVTEIAPLAAGQLPPPEGSYVITGGLGRFGRWVGRWLAEHGCRELFLLCRTGRPWDAATPAAGALAAMEAAGARVTVVQADVGDRAAVFDALDAAHCVGPVTILHLAGEPNADSANAPLDDLARGDIRAACVEQWAAKVSGAEIVLDWVRRHPETRCVTFSSNAGLLGGPSLAAYAAANAALDALACQAGDRENLRWTSVGWDGWRLPEDPPDLVPSAVEAFALRDGEPWAALQSVLATPRYHVVVAKGDLVARHRTWVEQADLPTAVALSAKDGTEPATHPATTAPGDATAAVRQIWAEVLGKPPPDDAADLYREGGDSLTAMRIRSRLERDLNTRLTLRELMANRTVAGLVELVRGHTGGHPAAAAGEPAEPSATVRGRI